MSSPPSSPFPFHIVEHTIECQHIREYPRALLHRQEDVLHLAVKQYIPHDNPHPQPGDITIIGAHANGFPKELYEPLWEDILNRVKSHNVRIRSIWIADVAQQGASGVLNEDLLGNDPSWNDHPRDLLHLINVKRAQMPRPLVGIGHSMGANHLAQVSLIHPRLLTTLILIDPVIQPFSSTPPEAGPSPAQMSTYRRDVWPSRATAAKSYKSSKFYQTWDPRVLDRWIQYGLRDLPTPLHPADDGSGKVTLTTTLHQEVMTFLRPNYEAYGCNGKAVDRTTHPDLDPSLGFLYPFYRAEPARTFFRLPQLRPSVLYIFGEQSAMSTPELRQSKLDSTGVGVDGSGGVSQGRVKGVTFEDIGHLVAMEAVGRTADETTTWLGAEMERWRKEEDSLNEWYKKSVHERRTVDDEWRRHMGPPPRKVKEKETGKAKEEGSKL